MKIEELKKNLYAQQSVMTSFCGTNDNVLTVSYEVSELIAKKLKLHDDGAWAKKLLVKATEKLAPKSVHLYQKLSLSRPTVCKRIKEMGQDIEDNFKKELRNSLTSPSVSMKQRTSRIPRTWKYFFERLHQIFNLMKTCSGIDAQNYSRRKPASKALSQPLGKFNLPLDKLCGVATDGAPAMVGKHKEMISFLKNEMDTRGIRHDRLVFFHCIVHQQNLCSKSVKFDHAVSVVTDCINFINPLMTTTRNCHNIFVIFLCSCTFSLIKKKYLKNRIFKQALKDFDADYDFLHFCAVRWMSCGNMLGNFHSLLPEIIEFKNLRNVL